MSNRNFDFSKVFWYGCHNCILRIPMKSFEKNCFNVKQKQFLFYLFCTFSGNKFEVRQKLSDSFTKFAIMTGRGKKIDEKHFFCGKPANFSNPFETLIKKIRNFPKFLRKISQTPFCVSRWTFGRERVFFKNLMTNFMDLEIWGKIFGLQRKTFSKVVKAVFRVSGELVWITTNFDRTNYFLNYFGLWGQTNSVFSKKLSRLSKNPFSVSGQMF